MATLGPRSKLKNKNDKMYISIPWLTTIITFYNTVLILGSLLEALYFNLYIYLSCLKMSVLFFELCSLDVSAQINIVSLLKLIL